MSNDENGVICTICLESLKKSNFNYPSYIPPVISLSCSHAYHFNCICSWFTKSCSLLCPVCKHPDNILLENFLPEIKNSLHNEILKSSRDFLTDEEYEKYCEDCIKQGNMLKMIEEQQMMMSSHNGNELNDEYYEDYSDDDNYPSPIAREHYYQNSCSPCPNRIASYPMESRQYDTIDTEGMTMTEMDDEPFNRDNPFTYTRRGYLFDGMDEDEDEVITYARGAINCILDDEEEDEEEEEDDDEECFKRIRNKSKNRKRNIDDKYNDTNKIHRKKNHNSPNKRSLDDFLRVLSDKEEAEEEETFSLSQQQQEKYENILLNTNPKPSFIHKYRFYIISSILFIIGYFLFL
ncbi:hypothetical protein PIROE2DRAFT_65483 [Piromyces sp. E2]|nr:hypothetical protein PIROE2DRAFT_65483 [Piromyces sp. E2]|eukprot:OUM56536.1 hypothetical protein PIROE2DRAFT_65483 [Piromyces sp. E2]